MSRHVRYNQDVTSARWDETAARWVLTSGAGQWRARFLVDAIGQLSRPLVADIPGAGTFAGASFHSARWRHDVDLSGQRVGIIGTGASTIQIAPSIASRVRELVIFQRSAPYVIDKRDPATSAVGRATLRALPWLQLPSRLRYWLMGEMLGRAIDGDLKFRAGATARWRKFRDTQVPEGPLREVTTPDYVLGCKRVLFSADWYPTLLRENVRIVTAPIESIDESGVNTHTGHEDLDVLVYATGFETTSFAGHLDVRGLGGTSLGEYWGRRPRAHRGVCVSGFPNFFMLYGPNTNLGSNSIILMLEAQCAYAASLIRATCDERIDALEVTEEAQAAFVAEIDAASTSTSWVQSCHSWYTVDGVNTNNWPHGTRAYQRLMRDIDVVNYRAVGAKPAPKP